MAHVFRVPSRLALCAVSFASLLATVSAQPASAHTVDFRGPNCGFLDGDCGAGGVSGNHTTVEACDLVADGDGFDVVWTTRSGRSGRVGDSNGSQSGCGSRTVTSPKDPVTMIILCNRTQGYCDGGHKVT